jgi:hypothetical protein
MPKSRRDKQSTTMLESLTSTLTGETTRAGWELLQSFAGEVLLRIGGMSLAKIFSVSRCCAISLAQMWQMIEHNILVSAAPRPCVRGLEAPLLFLVSSFHYDGSLVTYAASGRKSANEGVSTPPDTVRTFECRNAG